ncbi:MAG TPA: ribonuclease Z [Ktedonobacteraceae bacterium]|nr:ribonuclease Z [Ktedonobacteraceae bacterium]
MSSLTLLGTGTCQIEFERRASSVLLELDGTYILFDCGHGVVQRLLEAGVQHRQVQHIVLSHFHPDHVSDLVPFLQAGAWSRRNPRTQDVHIYGPAGVQRVVSGLMDVFGANSFQQSSYAIVVHEVTDERFEIDAHHFEFLSLPPAGNHGLRFRWGGRCYALTGDSYFHAEEIAFLKQSDLAVIDSGHIEDREIVDLAVASQAKLIVCSHLYREIDAARLQMLAAQEGYQGTILVGRDLMSFVL